MPLGRPGGLIDLWQRSGLDDVDGSRVGVSTSFEDFDDYWQPFLQGQGPAGEYVAGLSDAARAALRDEVAATVGDGPVRPQRDRVVGARHRARLTAGTGPPDGIRRLRRDTLHTARPVQRVPRTHTGRVHSEAMHPGLRTAGTLSPARSGL